MILRSETIGGGIVRRTFSNGDRRMRAGDKLTAEEVNSIPARNRQALIEKHYLDVYPAPPPIAGNERIVTRTPGFASKTYDVIEGRKIAEGLTKEQAEAVASGPAPTETTN